MHCGSRFVTAVESKEIGGGARRLLLRCGECATWRDAIAPPGAARAFDRASALQLEAIARALERLDLERMADQAEAFSTALRLDLIDAGDFR